jgi:hypothetical protein
MESVMATVPDEEFTGRQHIGEEAKAIVETMRQAVAGGRDASALVVVLLLITAGVLTLAPQPWAAIGVVTLTAVAYRLGKVRF